MLTTLPRTVTVMKKSHVSPREQQVSERTSTASTLVPADPQDQTVASEGSLASQRWRIEDLCDTHVSHTWLCFTKTLVQEVSWRRTTLWYMYGRERATKATQEMVAVGSVENAWTHSWNVEKKATPRKRRESTMHAFTRISRASSSRHEDPQKQLPGQLILSPQLLSQDAARSRMCVWLPPLLQQRVGTRRRRPLIGQRVNTAGKPNIFECEGPLVWTADGRPHPAVTRTMQYAGDIAVCQNGQQMSATALKHRWKHEVQIALLW